MKTVDKIIDLIEYNNLTAKEFSNALGFSPNIVSLWKTNKQNPTLEQIKKISDYFNVSVDYLLGVSDKKHETRDIGVKIPVYGTIAAGIPIEAIEEILDYEEIPKRLADSGDFFALKISGNSMSPRINNNDVVIIKQQPDVDDGQIGAVLVNGFDATLKKVKHNKDKTITLTALNKEYKPMVYNSEDVTILGLAYEVRSKLV